MLCNRNQHRSITLQNQTNKVIKKEWYIFVSGLPRWLCGKESAYHCGSHRRCGLNPWVRKDPLKKGMATHSNILVWKVLWIEEPDGLQSRQSQKVGHDRGELDYKESWAPKNSCFWNVMLEKTLESLLDCKEIQQVHPKGDQSWVFIGGTDVEAEIPILWPPDVKKWFIWKDPDAGKDWGQKEKGRTEDEMVGWHHWLSGAEFG